MSNEGIGRPQSELDEQTIERSALMRENVVTFDNTPQALFAEQPRERANHKTEERLPPLEDDPIRRETLDSLKCPGPGDRIKRIENRLGSSVERCGADIQLRLAGKKYIRIQLAEG